MDILAVLRAPRNAARAAGESAECMHRARATAVLSLPPEAVSLSCVRGAKRMMRFRLAKTIFSKTIFSKTILSTTISATVFSVISAASFGADSRTVAMLKGLDPATRFEQACDIEAMNRIGKDGTPFHPDRAVIDAVSGTKVSTDTMEGAGGAFRSGGKWYQFSFTCRTSPDRMKVLFFSYKVGTLIPEGKWEAYGLWR
jgi:hypothetical protein